MGRVPSLPRSLGERARPYGLTRQRTTLSSPAGHSVTIVRMKIELIAVGRLKKGPFLELFQDYGKRLKWPLTLIELESRYKSEAQARPDEIRLIAEHLKPEAYIMALDERGHSLTSRALAQKIEILQNTGTPLIQCVIGGANGLDNSIRHRADFLMGFGQQTWPHMLARIMLLEQIYRCQQILSGHPYHKD